MNKLFKPLNEQIEVVRIKNQPLTESDARIVSHDIIFHGNLDKLNEMLKFAGVDLEENKN